MWKIRSYGNIALSVLCYIFSKVSYFPVGYAAEIKACPPKKWKIWNEIECYATTKNDFKKGFYGIRRMALNLVADPTWNLGQKI